MIEFKLPALGADMDEGTLLEWKVRVGDPVKKGQVIAIVDTAKAAIDIECWQEGTIEKLLAEIGQKMPVGTVMALLREAGETQTKVGAGETPIIKVPVPPAIRHMISPAARKLAQEKGIDPNRLVGTGPHGSVTLDDVERAGAASVPLALPPTTPTVEDKTSAMRKAIGAAMARSKHEIPHYYVAEDIALARALAWLQAENADRPMAERLLPAVLLLKAIARTLRRFPELNGYYRNEHFDAAQRINLGVAIALRSGGLIAPSLFDVDAKPLTRLMQELTDLVQRARAGSLKSSEMSDATITVTNLGDQGSQSVFGVIYPPQVALIGMGRITERVWVEDGGIKIIPAVTASLSADHRVSDGHRGALFLRELHDQLQRPEELEK